MAIEQTFETLALDQIDRIVRITLNRPERRNAISTAMRSELVAAVEACAADDSVHAVVIRGAGSCFCAGYDISSAGDAPQVSLPRRAVETLAMTRAWSRIWDAPVPIVAQVHGHCLAGGTDLALSCDLVIVAEDATIGFPALRMGGTPPMNMWLYHCGPQWAKRLLFTGDTFTGRLAAQIGFALEAVPADKLEERVMALAGRVAAMGRDIVAINKHVINKGLDLMGRASLQEISAPMDAIANQAPEMAAFMARAQEVGLAAAFKERDAPFADGTPLDVGD
jgi:enoyl-CoA hydratase